HIVLYDATLMADSNTTNSGAPYVSVLLSTFATPCYWLVLYHISVGAWRKTQCIAPRRRNIPQK
ncbi:MAG: hypothetical protein ACKPKO_58005, partial [Candidatus Fonsibacter sp.]